MVLLRKTITTIPSPTKPTMSDSTQPSAAATILGVTPSTIRRWCEWHKEHLSGGANPAPGGRRHLSGRDLEVLREVKSLREQGQTTEQVNGRLGAIAFPDLPAPDSPGETIAPSVGEETQLLTRPAIEALATLPARVAALEAQRGHGFVLGLAVGLVVAALFFLIIVLLVRL